MFSAYLYFSMASYFSSRNLGGFESWMQAQAREETAHALKFYHHVNERGGRVLFEAIDKPESEWNSPAEAFEAVLGHEQFVTRSIHDLLSLAREEKDYPSETFLQWFVNEQVEEESTASDILERLKMIGENSNGILMLDARMGQRSAGS
jgi:ferritin